MNKKLKRKQALIMAEPYRTPFNSKVAKVSGDVIEDSVGGIKYATSFNGATKIVDGNKNKIKIKDGVYTFGKSVNVLDLPDIEETTVDGITYSIKDGVIIVNGVSTERNVTAEINLKNSIGSGTYSFNAFTTVGSRIDVYVNEPLVSLADLSINTTKTNISLTSATQLVLYFPKGIQYDNRVLKPMLVSGSTIPTKYYSGSYGIKIEVADGVATCNGMLASDSEQNWWYNFELPIPSGIYSANMFLRSPNINVYLSQDLADWSHSYQIAVKEAQTAPLSNIDIKTNCKYMFFSFDKEHDYDNLVLKPMLVLGTTAPTEFEPNFKNLLELEDKKETTVGNFKYSIKNGIITINGTTNGTYSVIYGQDIQNLLEDGATYSFNDISNNNYFYMQIGLVKIDGSTQYLTKKNSFTWSTSVYSRCNVKIQSNNVATPFDNLEIKPTLVKSTIIPTQFIPFANPYFVSLGQNGSVQYNGLEPREIDLKGNVISKINNQASDKLSNYALTKNTKVVDLGSLEWEATDKTVNNKYRMSSQSLKSEIVYSSSTSIVSNIISTTYNSLSTSDTYLEKKGISLEIDGTIKIYDPEYNTSDKLEAFKKAIRGTLLMYQVKNPTTINTTSFKTFKEDTNATISDDNFASSPNVITETFKPTRSYDFKVNGFSNVVKSSNLLNLTDKTDTTINGITYSIKDGVIKLNGTSTETTFIPLINGLNGRYYSINCFNNASNDGLQIMYGVNGVAWNAIGLGTANASRSIDFLEEQTNIMFTIRINQNTSLTNATIKPMLVSGSTIPTKYEPYFDPYIESFADKKNLLGFDDIEETTKGITYSIKNGIITLNGTTSIAYWTSLHKLKNNVNVGFYSSNIFNGTPTEKSSLYLYTYETMDNFPLGWYSIKENQYNEKNRDYLKIYIHDNNTVASNVVLKPMVVKGKTAPTTFLPYQDKYSAFLNVKGKNLLALPDIEETTQNGVTYSIKGGAITLNGTVTSIFSLELKNIIKVEENQTYYFYQKTENTVTTFNLVSNINNYSAEPTFFQYNNKSKKMTKTGYLTIHLYITNKTTFTNAKFYLMLVEGSTAPTEYEPYYSFTKEVLIKQPLRKFDYLTYDGVYRQTNEIVLDGTNNIYVDDKGKIFLLKIPNADSVGKNWFVNVASEIMVTTSNLPLLPYYNISKDNQMGIGTNQGNIILRLDDSADNSLNNWTVEKVNNYFKQNPITITYKTVDQTFEATSLTRLLFKNGYNKITAFDSINNNAIVEYLEYYKSKGD